MGYLLGAHLTVHRHAFVSPELFHRQTNRFRLFEAGTRPNQ